MKTTNFLLTATVGFLVGMVLAAYLLKNTVIPSIKLAEAENGFYHGCKSANKKLKQPDDCSDQAKKFAEGRVKWR